MSGLINGTMSEFELKNRTRGQDSRRLAFSKKIELFGLISDQWKVKKENEIKKVLETAPFRDV
ncbi:Imm63 family immunity protein [Acinetobacter johnsonii]|uniref:Imm63 family immunity protein n=1 Tax=Acinetobacter johnsonii TaxID=40214 RepID=UPI003C7E86B1